MRSDQCKLTAVGDMMFYGPMAEQMAAHNDPLWGFRPLGDALLKGDILFGNFETPITRENRNEPDSPDRYFSPPGVGRAIKEYGFDVVNLAHNHIYDFGAEGVRSTIDELREAELPFIGIGTDAQSASQPAIVKTASGWSVAFLGYTTAVSALDGKHEFVACFPKVSLIQEHVSSIRDKVDAVVVSCHTGSQYNPYPAPETRKLARSAIEAGASVFLGHHPHVPNGVERIGDGLAVYSLGDFVTPVHTEQTRRTFFIRITLQGRGVSDYEIVPCFITDQCQTEPASGKLKDEISSHISELTDAIASGRSDSLHFSTARGRFFSQYVSSWIEEYRVGGIKVLFRKVRNLRPYHAQLVWNILTGWIRRKCSRGKRL